MEAALTTLGARAVEGEIFLRESSSGSVEVKDGEIENVIAHGERGVGIRVLTDQRVGFAFTSDLRADGVAACVEAAIDMARITEPDPDLRIATDAPDGTELQIHEPGLDERPFSERVEVALRVERAAREVDARVSGFRKTSYGDADVVTMIATTSGARASYAETYFSAGTSVIASEGDQRKVGWHSEAFRRFSELSPERIGTRAAELAVRQLGARPFDTQRLPVVLDPYMGMALLGAIAPLFSADNVLKGKSLFAGKVGAAVANAHVTIVDDPRRPGGIRSAPFDGEGVTTTTQTLVQDGVLQGYLTSLKTSAKLGAEPTGNARRGSYSALSRIAPANFYISAGGQDPVATVGSLERAFAVRSLLNLHTIDPISGEFSLGASGDYLEKGERQYPIEGVTIAGNLTQLLSSISAVGHDLVFGPSGVGSPTLVVEQLSIGGR